MPRDKEKKRIYNAAYYRLRLPEIKKRQKVYYAQHRDHLCAYSRNWSKMNPEKVRAKRKQWNGANPDKVRAHRRASGKRAYKLNTPKFVAARRRYWLTRRYGITPEFYEQMASSQQGKCAICGRDNDKNSRWGTKERFLQVDHCHESKKVRGLLCYYCNVGLGMFRNNPDLLIAAARYLNR